MAGTRDANPTTSTADDTKTDAEKEEIKQKKAAEEKEKRDKERLQSGNIDAGEKYKITHGIIRYEPIGSTHDPVYEEWVRKVQAAQAAGSPAAMNSIEMERHLLPDGVWRLISKDPTAEPVTIMSRNGQVSKVLPDVDWSDDKEAKKAINDNFDFCLSTGNPVSHVGAGARDKGVDWNSNPYWRNQQLKILKWKLKAAEEKGAVIEFGNNIESLLLTCKSDEYEWFHNEKNKLAGNREKYEFEAKLSRAAGFDGFKKDINAQSVVIPKLPDYAASRLTLPVEKLELPNKAFIPHALPPDKQDLKKDPKWDQAAAEAWLQNDPAGQKARQNFLKTAKGKQELNKWLESKDGQDWIKDPKTGGAEANRWLKSDEGKKWLDSDEGKKAAKKWLTSDEGKAWTQRVMPSSAAEYVVLNHRGSIPGSAITDAKSLPNIPLPPGKSHLDDLDRKNWLMSPAGDTWLNSPEGMKGIGDWLVSKEGRKWSQDPAGGKAVKDAWDATKTGADWAKESADAYAAKIKEPLTGASGKPLEGEARLKVIEEQIKNLQEQLKTPEAALRELKTTMDAYETALADPDKGFSAEQVVGRYEHAKESRDGYTSLAKKNLKKYNMRKKK